MASVLTLLSWLALGLGLLFFLIAALGLLRFPDLYSRLHAAACADSIGFALLTFALLLRAADLRSAFILLAVCLLTMVTGAVDRQLLARYGEDDHPHMGDHAIRKRS